jgi:hypothetical protein
VLSVSAKKYDGGGLGALDRLRDKPAYRVVETVEPKAFTASWLSTVWLPGITTLPPETWRGSDAEAPS